MTKNRKLALKRILIGLMIFIADWYLILNFDQIPYIKDLHYIQAGALNLIPFVGGLGLIVFGLLKFSNE